MTYLISYTGNIFGIDEVNYKKLIEFFLIFIIETALGYFFLKNVLDVKTIANLIIIGVLAPCLIYTLKYKKDLIKTTRDYLRPEMRIILFLVLELILIIWLLFGLKDLPKYLLIPILIFWGLSGYLRTILTQSKALFNEDIERLRNNFVIYGYSRLSYFAIILLIPFILLTNVTDMIWFFIIYYPFILLFYYFVTNVSPYAQRSIDVKRSIEILRYIKDNKPSRENLRNKFDNISQEKLDYILYKFIKFRYITKENRKYDISKVYRI